MPMIQEEYVDQAKKVIEELPKNKNGDFLLTTNQLRNLLSLTAQIFDEAETDSSPKIAPSLKDKVQYLRVRFIYQAGREPSVHAFVQKAKLLEALAEVGDSRDKLITFCRYMEALVAYKKYLDPKDK